MLFFWNFFSRSVRNSSERFFFYFFYFLFSLFLGLSQSILAWKEAIMVFTNFVIFFGIFYSMPGRNWSERLFLFYLFLDLSQPILAWKEAIMVFTYFLNFFAIFLEFSIPCRAGTDWTIIFIFSLSRPFPIYFGLKRSCNGVY